METGLSQNAIVRIWHAFGLQPHRVENLKILQNPQFVEKVRDIVGLYLNPPDRAVVLCLDEKSQAQALNRTEPILPIAPGVPARQTHASGMAILSRLSGLLTDLILGKVQRLCKRISRSGH